MTPIMVGCGYRATIGGLHGLAGEWARRFMAGRHLVPTIKMACHSLHTGVRETGGCSYRRAKSTATITMLTGAVRATIKRTLRTPAS